MKETKKDSDFKKENPLFLARLLYSKAWHFVQDSVTYWIYQSVH
jgi:hypothetical protein